MTDPYMYRHFEVGAQALRELVKEARRIANCMEAQEARARVPVFEPGSQEHWMNEVAQGRAVNGYAEWKAWYESDQLERAGEAIAAVKRGFADMEAQVRGERDD